MSDLLGNVSSDQSQFVTLQLNFAGRVQGVGFRATSAELARRFPVSGWVRNLSDGTVEMQVSGVEAAVEQFIAAVRNRFGRSLTGVTCRKVEPPQEFTDFRIRY